MDRKAKIRYEVLVAGKSQREIAKELGCSRNTVRRMLEDSQIPNLDKPEPKRV